MVLAGSIAAAQTADEDAAEPAKGQGITATLELKIDAFNLKNSGFGHAELRGPHAQNNTVSQFFINTSKDNPNASNSWADSELSIGYEGEYFGGNYALKADDFTDSPYKLIGKVRGWVQFSFFKVLIGNDIETSYADALDADPGLRIYTGGDVSDKYDWQAFSNPDNITQDEGIMVEGLFGRFNIALAAGEFLSAFDPSQRQKNGTNEDNEYLISYDSSYRLGGRLGYDIGEPGKVNLAYILTQKKIASMYKPIDGERVPDSPDAQVYTHQFGAYGTLHLTPQIDLTIGYNGILTAYLDEVYTSAADVDGWIETGYPIIFKNGLNINARAELLPQLTLRTDNSASYWQDKNYDIFETKQAKWNYNTVSKTTADTFAVISHFIIWNGLGADYNFTDKLTGSLYLRNLFGRYSVSGKVPKAPTAENPAAWGYHEYVLTRDQVHVKLGIAYQFTSSVKAYAEVIVEDTITIRSLDLNSQTASMFETRIHGRSVKPAATTDNELVLRIPIGITLQLR